MGLDYLPSGIACGAAGSILGSTITVTVPANSVLLLSVANGFAPGGTYVMRAVGANTTLQCLDETATWRGVTAAGVGAPLVNTDGINWRLSNAAGADQTVAFQRIG